MKILLVSLIAALSICINCISQESARLYLNSMFEVVEYPKNAVIIRDALIKDGRYYISDQFADGRMILSGEYNSVDPWTEDGLFVFYDHKGSKYAEGVFRNGKMNGQWIYFDSTGTDTVVYEAEWGEIVKSKRPFRVSDEFKPISDELGKYIQSKVHYPPRMLYNCISFRKNFQFEVNKEKELQLTFPVDEEIDFCVETYRVLHDTPDSLIFNGGGKKNLKYAHGIEFICNRPFVRDSADDLPGCNSPAFIFTEELALFQNGTIENFREWVQKNLIYPPQAIKDGISGRITVQFTVTSDGKVDCIKILRSCGELLDNEAIRVIKNSPIWTPARQGGRAVNQQFVMPVIFMLQGEIIKK